MVHYNLSFFRNRIHHKDWTYLISSIFCYSINHLVCMSTNPYCTSQGLDRLAKYLAYIIPKECFKIPRNLCVLFGYPAYSNSRIRLHQNIPSSMINSSLHTPKYCNKLLFLNWRTRHIFTKYDHNIATRVPCHNTNTFQKLLFLNAAS